MPRAVALYSGGLDSTLAIRIFQEQGWEVEALNIRTTFDCCRVPATQTASQLGVRLTVLSVADDYVEVIRNPSYGYGKGLNPCVDCRIYMCQMAKRFMEQVHACLVITGEILGQRPMSQKRQDLDVIATRSGLQGRLMRPLSARLLPPTIPEQKGLIDREQLYDFTGRERRPLIELAERLGIAKIPQPSTGCALTETSFAPRVRDLISMDSQAARADFELLNYGRHIRFDEQTKIALGRNAKENAALRTLFEQVVSPRWTLVQPRDFLGPDAVVVGAASEEALAFAGALLLRYAGIEDPAGAEVSVTRQSDTQVLRALPLPPDQTVSTLSQEMPGRPRPDRRKK